MILILTDVFILTTEIESLVNIFVSVREGCILLYVRFEYIRTLYNTY